MLRVPKGRSVAARIPVELKRRLKQLSGVASSQDVTRLESSASRRSAEINHGLVVLAQRVTSLEDLLRGIILVRLGEVEGRLNGLAARIGVEHERVVASHGEMLSRTDGLITQHAEIVDWLTGLDPRLESLRGRLEDLSRRVAGANLLRDSGDAIQSFTDTQFGAVEGFRRPRGEDANTAGIYIGFEGWFRGTEQVIAERQQVYVEALRSHGPVFDVGCGRGEMLELLSAEGISARGVDTDAAMVARCLEKGLDVTQTNAVAALSDAVEGSVGAVFAAQVIEHLPYPQLLGFLAAAKHALRDDGVLIVETVNPHSPQGLKHFWVDPTHQHPLFPETVLSLCYFSGYSEAFCWYPQGTGHPDADRLTQLDYAIVARPG